MKKMLLCLLLCGLMLLSFGGCASSSYDTNKVYSSLALYGEQTQTISFSFTHKRNHYYSSSSEIRTTLWEETMDNVLRTHGCFRTVVDGKYLFTVGKPEFPAYFCAEFVAEKDGERIYDFFECMTHIHADQTSGPAYSINFPRFYFPKERRSEIYYAGETYEVPFGFEELLDFYLLEPGILLETGENTLLISDQNWELERGFYVRKNVRITFTGANTLTFSLEDPIVPNE